MTTTPSRVVLGPEADRLLSIATDEDASAWLPLADVLEEDGHPALAALAREASAGGYHYASFFVRVAGWLHGHFFDRETMTAVVARPPFGPPGRHWLVWKSIEVKPGWYARVAMVTKGAPDR